MYAAVDENGRICATTDDKEYAEGMIEIDFPEDFDFTKQDEYRYVDGELVHDPKPPSEEELAAEETRQRNAQIQLAIPMMVQLNSADILDAQAVTIPLLFKKWTPGEKYTLHEIVRYEVDGELYRIGQPEIRALDVYKPGDIGTESIYSHIKINEEGYEEWKPWDGISGIYKQDQIVSDPYDEGNLYKSKIPNNVWGPPSQQPTYWKKV
mgnify:CR=1 FL=1